MTRLNIVKNKQMTPKTHPTVSRTLRLSERGRKDEDEVEETSLMESRGLEVPS